MLASESVLHRCFPVREKITLIKGSSTRYWGKIPNAFKIPCALARGRSDMLCGRPRPGQQSRKRYVSAVVIDSPMDSDLHASRTGLSNHELGPRRKGR